MCGEVKPITGCGRQNGGMRGDHIDFGGATFYGPVYGKVKGGVVAVPVSTLPGAPEGFTGREREVAAVLGALGRERVVSVSGLAGVGKTALAVAVAHEARGRGMFPGGVLFVDLRGYDEVPVSAEQAVSSLLLALGVREGEFARYRSELASREAMLVVLDNAGGSEQVVPLLPGEGAGHRVLVTSRDVLDSFAVGSVVVEALSVGAGVELVGRVLGGDRRVSEEGGAVRELVEVCGRLPLALVIVAALLRRRRGLGVGELVAELRGARDRVGAFVARGVDQYGRSLVLRPVFDAMYRRLGVEAARVFGVLGLAPGEVIRADVGRVLAGVGEREWGVVVDDLVAASLLSVVGGGGEGWRMHDLVRVYAASRVSGEVAEEAKKALLRFYSVQLEAADAVIENPNVLLREMFPGGQEEALGWFETERTGLINAVSWAEGGDARTAVLVLRLSRTLIPRLGAYRALDDVTRVSGIARDTARRLGRPLDEAAALGGLAFLLTELRRFDEAIGVWQQALNLQDGAPIGQAKAWSYMAATLSGLGRFDEAIDTCAKSLRYHLTLDDRPQVATTRAQLAMVLAESGRLDEACAMSYQAATEFEQLGMARELADSLHNLGNGLRLLGRPAEALPHIVHSLRIRIELNDWRYKTNTWIVLGFLFLDLGQPDRALRAFTRTLDWSALLGDKYQAAVAWANIGTALGNLKRYREAVDACGTAIELGAALEEWRIVGAAHFAMGSNLFRKKRKRDATRSFQAAADAYERAGMSEAAANMRELADGS
ncbi:tetratricopeptide repeat protein [Streptomyces roseirectus]|uniref:Tetratricopeptide repeat protein n=1 Tax=Streptomyces roseirectus TaxID=2768066 RepID=A0A7H0IB25_9ACTN|nr:tetratricopeptide repeat protein [Streptomyces roseirectus]QNP69991.1 tetratricopeptide repeat protein [Streptomyces roseirectus]